MQFIKRKNYGNFKEELKEDIFGHYLPYTIDNIINTNIVKIFQFGASYIFQVKINGNNP